MYLKKLRRTEEGAKILGVFRVKNHYFTPKNHSFYNYGGRREKFWGISCFSTKYKSLIGIVRETTCHNYVTCKKNQTRTSDTSTQTSLFKKKNCKLCTANTDDLFMPLIGIVLVGEFI
jgi:hypothetical protein